METGGEMAEWSKAVDSKSTVPLWHRGFESLSLRPPLSNRERCESGRIGAPGERVGSQGPQGFKSLLLRRMIRACAGERARARFLPRPGGRYTVTRGRARRGASGALYPQSALAGLNSRPRTAVVRKPCSEGVEGQVLRNVNL